MGHGTAKKARGKVRDEIMKEKCDTCAFRPGTQANRSALTVLKARLCAQAGQPFHCHENAVFVTPSGKEIKTHDRNRIDVIGRVPHGEYKPKAGEDWKICAGFMEMVLAQSDKQLLFTEDWQIELSKRLLEVIEKAELEGEEWDEARSAAEIRAVIDSMKEVYGGSQ